MANDPITIVGISYVQNGRTYYAEKLADEALQRLHREGKFASPSGECTCGSPDFCDTFAHRRVRCFSVAPDRCELFTTNDVC